MSHTIKRSSKAKTAAAKRIHEEFTRKFRSYNKKICKDLRLNPEKDITYKAKNIEFSNRWLYE